MSDMLPILLVLLPLAAAGALACAGSWRFGIWLNAGIASLHAVLALVLVWRVASLETGLVLLTSFVGLTTSWFAVRDIPVSLAARVMTRRRVQLHHVSGQVLIGAIVAAMLVGDPVWACVALVVAVGAATAVMVTVRTSSLPPRVAQQGAIGLLLAFLGMLLLPATPDLAGTVLLLGLATVGGLLPLHSWLVQAATETTGPGSVFVATLLPNVPLLLLARLPIQPGLLTGFGLAVALLFGLAAQARLPPMRAAAVGGIAQFGAVLVAIGIGASTAAWLLVALLTLTRAALFHSKGKDMLAWLTLALLPLYALVLLAVPIASASMWLLLPLAVAALLTTSALLRRCPAGWPADPVAAAPVWLQLAMVALLAFAMPLPAVTWFGAMAAR